MRVVPVYKLLLSENNLGIDWKDIELVIFDMDGTLLDLHFDNYFWLELLPLAYSVKHSFAIKEAKAYIHKSIMESKGQLQWYSTDYWSQVFDIDIMALKHVIAHKISLKQTAYVFLALLRAAEKPMWLATNSDRKGLALKLERSKIALLFEEIISSHDIGYAKEEPRFWELLHSSCVFNAKKTVLFDDNEDVLRTAENFGIKHCVQMLQPDSMMPIREAVVKQAIVDFQVLYTDNINDNAG